MKLLLAGGSGFIGQQLIKKLSVSNEIYSVSRTSGKVNNNVENINVDLREENLIRQLPSEIDAVISLIQSPNYRFFPDGALDVYQSSVIANINLANYGLKNKVDNFIFFSSGSVYENYTVPLLESQLLNPESLNGKVKLATESVLNLFEENFNLCIFRLFFPYGPGQVDRMIPILADKIRNEEPVMLEGERGLFFNPIFSEDIAMITERAIIGKWKGCFNLAGTKTVSVKEVSDLIGVILGRSVRFDRETNQTKKIIPKTDKLYALIDECALTPLSDGLKQTLNFGANR